MELHENLKHIYNLMRKKVNSDLDSLGLTCSQSGILLFILLNNNKEINQREIEKHFNLSNPTVNGILNRLESKGLIKRISNENDKRIKNIVALKKSANFIEQVEERKNQMENSMLKNIKKEELETFYNVLEKMINNLKENLNERNI